MPALALAAPGAVTNDPAKVPAGSYALDKAHASLTAKIMHMGFSQYTFRFKGLDSSFDFDPAKIPATKLMVAVDVKSIDTGDAKFDAELSGANWLDAAKYPTMTFVSTGVMPGADAKGQVSGDLTLHGVTKPVTLDVVFNGVGAGIIPGSTRLGFSAVAKIKRSDFGVTKYVPLVGDDMTLLIEVEYTKK
jgi:polyisoprenoid-binding protein YceI